MRKPAFKASWSTRASPGVRAPQRPATFTRPTAGTRPQHTTHSSTVHRPVHNAVSHMYRNTAYTNVHARNTQSLAMRSSLATPRPSQNAQMMNRNLNASSPSTNNNGCVPYPSQNNHSTNNNGCAPYPSQKTQSMSNNDCAPYPSQKTKSMSNNDCAPYPSQKTKSMSNNDCAPYPSQNKQSVNSNDCVPYPSQNKQSTNSNLTAPRPSENTESQSGRDNVATQRPSQNTRWSRESKDVQASDDAAHNAKLELMRQYSAPQPQGRGTADFLRRVPSSGDNSTPSSGNSTVRPFVIISSATIRCDCERVSIITDCIIIYCIVS